MKSAVSIIFGYGFLIVGLLFFGTAIVQVFNLEWVKAALYLGTSVICVPLGVYLTGTYDRWKSSKEAQLRAQKLAEERARKTKKR
jgi:hypothetical protein